MGQENHGNSVRASDLTVKQRAVLDLLIQHKTSKEIARVLDISPHTVDQRINFAKDKLGASTRGEVAVIYRRLLETCERSACELSDLPNFRLVSDGDTGSQGSFPVQPPAAADQAASPGPETDFPVIPAMFDSRYGTFMRSGAIFAIAAMMAVCVLGGLAIYAQLSAMLHT